MLDLRLLYELDITRWLIMAAVFYGVVRLTKFLLIRK